jgi:antitoxin component of MazEF toxin-antitoxin module
MGYPVKIQKVERPTNRSYYVNLPTAVAEMMQVEKGEQFEWLIEDRNILILKRVNPQPPLRNKSNKAEK